MKTIKLLEDKSHQAARMSMTAICFTTGLAISACLISFFFIMRAFNLHEVFELRFFNALILLPGILIGFNTIVKKTGHKLEYFYGLKSGIKITAAAAIPFAIFIGIYLYNDAAFMDLIKTHQLAGRFLNPFTAATEVAMEGMIGGIIMTYVLLPYFKKA